MLSFVYFSLLVTCIVFLLQYYLKYYYGFWKKANVPHCKFQFPLGVLHNGGLTKNLGVLYNDIYKKFAEEKFYGLWLFVSPVFVVKDPDLIKTILVKDFNSFVDRGLYYNEKDDPLSAHLFSIEGEKWRNLRAKLSPTFTSAKMKMMFPLMIQCATELNDYLKVRAARGELIEIVEIMARFTTDVISLCAFGIRTNSLHSPESMFREMGKRTTEPNLRNFMIFLMQMSFPSLLKLTRARVLYKDVADYFMKTLKEVMDYREQNNIVEKDFLQLLIQLKNDGALKDTENLNGKVTESAQRLTFEEAAAEAFVFFLAGSETSSSTLQYALYEVAHNPDVQERLRSEIFTSLEKNNGKLTYEVAHNIPYLDKVIDETLRKYPIVPLLFRYSRKNYKIPNSDAIIPKDTMIHIPVYSLHSDEKHYPQPEKFDPERFSDEEKHKRHPFTYLPFGEGPRNCIGKRFGQMQVKVGLITLLRNYRFEPSGQSKNPVTFDAKSFLLVPTSKLQLKITPV